MARPKLPERVPFSFQLQPAFHKDIIDYVNTIPANANVRSEYFRAALRIIRDHPELLKDYMEAPPEPPQMAINEFLNKNTG